MKTLQEVYDAIMANDELKKKVAEALKRNKMDEFLTEQGCDANQKEFEEFLTEKAAEVKPEDLAKIAGGMGSTGVKTDTNILLDPVYSNMMPWICKPNYSSLTDENGKFTGLVCG